MSQSLQQAYAEAEPFSAEFVGPNGLSVLPGGFGRSTFAVAPRIPLAVSGSGCRIVDDAGRELIDVHNNFTALIHGHAHPAVVEAAERAFRNGSAFGLPNRVEFEHAQMMIERLDCVDQIRYANSGTEAVMLAVRLARAVTGRDKIVFVRMAYHGHSDIALIPGGTAARKGVPAGVIQDTIEIAVNDVAGLTEVLESQGSSIAAVIVDHLANRSGLIAVTPEFWSAARTLTQSAGALLISDEVIALRLGYAGAAAAAGIAPDLVTMGKIIGGGTPVGAVAGRADVMAGLDPFQGGLEHGGTFSGNPVTMAAGIVTMTLFDETEVSRLNSLGDHARAALASRIDPLGWEVRGQGSLFRPFPRDLEGASVKKLHTALWFEAYDRGVLVGQNCAGALSTPMDEAIVDDVVERLADALEAVVARVS